MSGGFRDKTMEDFIYDNDDVPEYDPMEAYDISVQAQAEPIITLNLVPADAAGTTFHLSPIGLGRPSPCTAPSPTTPPHTTGTDCSPSPLHLDVLDYRAQCRDVNFHPPGHSPRGYSAPSALSPHYGARFLPPPAAPPPPPSPPALVSPHLRPDLLPSLQPPTGQVMGQPPRNVGGGGGGGMRTTEAASDSYVVGPEFSDPKSAAPPPPPPSYQDFLLRQQLQQQQLGPTDPKLLRAGEVSSQQLAYYHQSQHQDGLQNQSLHTKQLSGDRILYFRPPHGDHLPVTTQGPPPPPLRSPGHAAPPPPYQSQTTPKKQKQHQPVAGVQTSGAVVNLDFASIPGVNLKKANVDLAVYVASLVPFKHPHFTNVDGFVERCLACIVRKIRSNLPTLYTLLRVIRHSPGDPDPGCVLVPRTKDSRITVARPGAGPVGQQGGGGSKKIHPHLALVQMFRHPQVLNPANLSPSPLCSSPFAASGSQLGEEGGLLCISPLHYMPGDNPSRSPGAARRSTAKVQQPRQQNHPRNNFKGQDAGHLKKMKADDEEDSDSDFLSDTEDDIDWEERWRNQSVAPKSIEVQVIDEESLRKEITFLKFKSGGGCVTKKEPVGPKMLERLKIMEDLRCLFRGKYDLSCIAKPNTKGPRSKTRKYLARQRDEVSRLKAEGAQREGQEVAPQQHREEGAQLGVPGEKNDMAIQDLFDQDSFDTDLDMDLDSFSQEDTPFAGQDFSIANTFSMTGFDEALPGMQNKSGESGRSIAAGSSDAMFGGGSAGPAEPYGEEEGVDCDEEEGGSGLPCIVSSWSVAEVPGSEGDERFLMFDPPAL